MSLGRVFKALVSAYDRSRTQVGQVRRQEKRTVVADFNGAIEPDRTIESVTWRCPNPWVLAMSDAAVADDQRSVSVLADFQFGGYAALRATVTLDNGDKLNQVFEFTVRDAPWFWEDAPVTSGPFVLTATAD